MPTVDTGRSKSSKNDAFSKEEGAPLLMTVTQSKSFGSTITSGDLDGQELTLSLSASTDSMGFDFRGNSFEEQDSGKVPQKKDLTNSPNAMDSNMSITSAGTKETASTSSITQESSSSRPPYPYSHGGYGPPPSYGRPPYPTQGYPHPYYSGHYHGGHGPPPPPPPNYGGPQGVPPPNYHPYYRGYPPPGYPPHPSYQHGQVPARKKSSTTSSSRHPAINPSVSSTSSVTSNTSKKRTIDEMSKESQNEFSIHRGGSNISVCSAGTAPGTKNSISKLVCESPMKKERNEPPVHCLERSNSMESTESSLTFGALSMSSSHDFDGTRLRHRHDHQKSNRMERFNGSPLDQNALQSSRRISDNGVTPISKNTKSMKRQNSYFFKNDPGAPTSENDFTPLPSMDSDGKKFHGRGRESISPDLSLDIKPQLSWNLADDGELAETPVSFGSNGNISLTFWKGDGKSPSNQTFDSISSPVSLSDGMLAGNSSPIPVFFNGPQNEKNRPKAEPVPSADVKKKKIEPAPHPTPTPSTPMPLHSPYYHGPPTPHSSMRMREDMYNAMSAGRRDGPPNYNSPRPMYHPPDRVVNLRGQRATIGGHHAPPQLHLPPHIPSHHHFLTSPIGAPTPRSMMGLSSPHHTMSSPYHAQHTQGSPHVCLSKRRCMPLKQPIPSKFQGDMEKYKNAIIPEFTALVNFPSHMSQKQAVSLPDGMRCCVMCGQACRCSTSKNKKGAKKDDLTRKGVNNQYSMIPTQNKGLCTQCDVNVWVVASSQLEIKWCKGCKNFRPWAAFGEKGLATKCVRCRDRQREKYAAQKEEKDKRKAMKNRK